MKKAMWIGFAALVASVNGMIFAGDEEEKKEKQEVVVVEEPTADNCSGHECASADEKAGISSN